MNTVLPYRSLLLVFITLASCGSPDKPGYDAGFMVVRGTDSSRTYRPDADSTDKLYYRPVDIDVWYPAHVQQQERALTFGDFLRLLEQRANYYTGNNNADGASAKIAQSFCDGFRCSDSSKLMAFPTFSYDTAPLAEGKFPLILYLASYNGMGYENYLMFEQLVKKGFVVVSVSSIGRYPGDMTMKQADMEEQVADALYTLRRISGSRNIDLSRIGIAGYSWGGVAGALLSKQIPGVRCVVSLEGSEFHHYESSPEEDADFDGIRHSPAFASLPVPMPYLRLESSSGAEGPAKDSVYNFSEKLTGKLNVIQAVDSAQHEDFSCFPVITRASGGCKDKGVYGLVTGLVSAFLEKHLK